MPTAKPSEAPLIDNTVFTHLLLARSYCNISLLAGLVILVGNCDDALVDT